ncbi:NAD-dependent protein deacetylase hst1 [Cyphellophora attinorum]|uniref:NAD-dependent protein deacetylase hst1 n=1 Tax=Cyphellophora attinorum TaxID=1664694 RepID=A0A0N0NKC3_9EURO|nr:NAD-dependent protein deacetylase hst1 [Phialophora attinorum]KPI37868.1 NAD-dependent protein deacetylase hst1 [Phialophora attinorum]
MAAEKRRKLNRYNTVDDAVRLLKESKNIGILCGAGISTAVGIPDFRSKDGLYNSVTFRFTDPQQLFYRETFEDDPKAFWTDVFPIVPKLIQGDVLRRDGSESKHAIAAIPKYSKVHSFFDLLQSKGKLNTIFTQNIDALELAADVEPDKIIACHGSWDTATCLSCDGKIHANDYLPVVLDHKLPLCECGRPEPADPNARKSARTKKEVVLDDDQVRYLPTYGGQQVTQKKRVGRKKRRAMEAELDDILKRDSDDDDKFDPPARRGLLKPDITFFGESVVSSYQPRLDAVKDDLDLLIIIGTSLAAAPVSQLPLEIPPDVPQIWVSNKTLKTSLVRGLQVDIELIGDADSIITELCARTGWSNGLTNRIWRNHLGSRKQGRIKVLEQVAAARTTDLAKPAAAETAEPIQASIPTLDGTTESNAHIDPVAVGLGLEAVATGLLEPAVPEKTSLLPLVKQQSTNVAHTTSTPVLTTIDSHPAADSATSIVDAATAVDPGLPLPPLTTAPPVVSAVPAVSISPSKSPPLPFRSGIKRPLSIGDALTPPASSVKASALEPRETAKALPPPVLPGSPPDSSPLRPTKVARTQSITNIAERPAVVATVATPAEQGQLKIFADDIFEHITYFKRR